MGWTWESDNGCTECEGLAGEYEEEADLPDRPHPDCRCEIQAEEEEANEDECVNEMRIIYEDYEWKRTDLWFDNGERHWSGEMTLKGRVEVECWNGEEYSEDVEITLELEFEGEKTEYTPDEVDWDDQWRDAAEAKVLELVDQCPPCPAW